MLVVYNKEQLKSALQTGEDKIIVKGVFAEGLKKKISRVKKGGIVVAAATVLSASFTGGLSVMGLTVGGFTISAVELAILAGLGIGLVAILKGYSKIKFGSDGCVEISK